MGFRFAKSRQSSLSMGAFSRRLIRSESCIFRGWEASRGNEFQFGFVHSLDSVSFRGYSNKEVTYVCMKGLFLIAFQISLHFRAFELRTTRGCQGDYVKVYDGSSKYSTVLMDKTCGSQIPTDVVSSSNLMLIEFVTDSADTASGFQATFTSGRSENMENGREKKEKRNPPKKQLSNQ